MVHPGEYHSCDACLRPAHERTRLIHQINDLEEKLFAAEARVLVITEELKDAKK